jgi:hypothetical protein
LALDCQTICAISKYQRSLSEARPPVWSAAHARNDIKAAGDAISANYTMQAGLHLLNFP